jgi:hypothetical protein
MVQKKQRPRSLFFAAQTQTGCRHKKIRRPQSPLFSTVSERGCKTSFRVREEKEKGIEPTGFVSDIREDVETRRTGLSRPPRSKVVSSRAARFAVRHISLK